VRLSDELKACKLYNLPKEYSTIFPARFRYKSANQCPATMMLMKFRRLLSVLIIPGLCAFLACSKQTDTLNTEKVTDYYPLAPGKFAIYQLDSTVYVSFGQVREVRRHIIKDVVDSMITDNLGRPSYRIRRYFQSKTDVNKWEDRATYLVTPQPYSVEVIEDNLRFIKLQGPVTEFFSWNGNRYLPDEVYTQFGFNSTAHARLGSWEYNYTEINTPATINGKTFDSTLVIGCSIEDTSNFPPRDPNGPAFKTVWTEKYAKGVGLIYKEVSLEEFQPRSTTYPSGYYSGFALKQSLLSHN
jgi:hypothetical protein